MSNSSNQHHPLLEASRNFADNTAIICGEDTLSYSQLFESALELARFLSDKGVKQGDVVILDQMGTIPMIQLLWACSISGIQAFPINTRFPQSTLIDIIDRTQPALVFSDRGITSDSIKYSAIITGRSTYDLEKWNSEKPATLMMTSGSSGQSKIVVHSHRNHIASAIGSNMNIQLEQDDRWLLTLPLYHVGGLSVLYRTTLAGSAVVVPSSVDDLFSNIIKHSVTHISLVATQLQRILQEEGSTNVLKQLKAILLGGGAIPRSLVRESLSHNLPIHLSYGSTEMSSQICTTSSEDRVLGLNHSGKVLDGRDLIISHEGEILVRGETLASGYLEGSDITELRDDEGWFHTGDIGFQEVSGAITVLGRMDNQFISGGENIQPEYIESTLLKMAGVKQAIILPTPDDEFGERPVAYMQLDDPGPSIDEINDLLRRSLPGYMIPVNYYHLPQSFTVTEMKISRNELANYLADPNNHLQTIQ